MLCAWIRVLSQLRKGTFLFSKTPRPDLGPTHPPVWVPSYLSSRVVAGCLHDRLLPCRAKVKQQWIHSFTACIGTTLSLPVLVQNHNHDAFNWGQFATHLSPSANVKNSWSFTSTPPASLPLTSVPPPEVRSLLQIRHASIHPHGVIVQYGRVFVASWWQVAVAAGTRSSARPNAG